MFLSSGDSDFTTGQLLNVDGGITLLDDFCDGAAERVLVDARAAR
jgi:hypothetical protein